MWILLHGFTGSPESWNALRERGALEEPLLTPALMGHGDDWRRTEVARFDEECERLIAQASQASRPRLLCGYSMGSRVALGMLCLAPALFDGAVLVGVHPGLKDGAARLERRRMDAERASILRSEGVSSFISAWERAPLFSTQRSLPGNVLSEQRRIRLGHDAEGLARSLEVLGLAEMPAYAGALSEHERRIVVLAGGLDPKFSKIARSLAEDCSQVDARIVPESGHNVVLEAPDALMAAMTEVEENTRR